jgi:hypothetical protein
VLLVPEDARPTVAPRPGGVEHEPKEPDHRIDLEAEGGYDAMAMHSAGRNIKECWAYSSDGHVSDADVTITYDPLSNNVAGLIEQAGTVPNTKDLSSWIKTVNLSWACPYTPL